MGKWSGRRGVFGHPALASEICTSQVLGRPRCSNSSNEMFFACSFYPRAILKSFSNQSRRTLLRIDRQPKRSHRRSAAIGLLQRRVPHIVAWNSASPVRQWALVGYLKNSIVRLFALWRGGGLIFKQLPRLLSRVKPAGPASLLFLILGLIGAGIATVRQKIIINVRSCRSCFGYGIERCSLCSGRGMVGWEGKWSHREPCPMCLGRRFMDCSACGGKFHRPLFQHIQTTAASLIAEIDQQEALLKRTALAD